jgi:hypothetical protein
MGVSPVSLAVSSSEKKPQDRAETALEHTGKMPVPRRVFAVQSSFVNRKFFNPLSRAS